MKVTRTSGLPIEPTDLPKYQADLEANLEALKEELGAFEKLDNDAQKEFVRRFEQMREDTRARYKCEDEWDFETVLKSKTKLKELVNRFGVIAFARGSDTKQLQCFIVDSTLNQGE